jgi:hypothetical protein
MKQYVTRRQRRMVSGGSERVNENMDVLKDRLRKSYKQHEILTRGYDWAAAQDYDAVETTGETIIKDLSITVEELNFFFTEIERNRCGVLFLGRKGWKTRMRWSYSLRGIGRMAQGHADTLAQVDPEAVADSQKLQKSTKVNTLAESGITIPEAKRRLALTFGVPTDTIEIIIRG